MAKGRRPSIEEIIKEEMFREEQRQALEGNPESMYNNPMELEGGVDPSGPLMTDKRPMTRWNEPYDDSPTEEALAAAQPNRGAAIGREFGPRLPQEQKDFRDDVNSELPPPPPEMMDPAFEGRPGADEALPPPPPRANPNAVKGDFLRQPYNTLPQSGAAGDYGMKVMPQVPQQDMQQLMDFYMNGGTEI